MKAILELDYMPNNCGECVLSTKDAYRRVGFTCAAIPILKEVNIRGDKRPEFCPLKELKGDS